MSIIQAYKSDADGKVFEHKADYSKHLRKLATKRREVKRAQNFERNREAFFTQMGQVASFQELEQFIKDNWAFFRHNGQRNASQKRISTKDDVLIDLKLHDTFTFNPKLSNSHNCPRRGVQNFDTRAEHNKGKPTGYPGWYGRITFSVTITSSFGSDYFNNTPICTGTGGGGDSRLSYDLKIWADDFPVLWEKHCRDIWAMKENQQRMYVWRQLGGKGLCTPVTDADIPSDWVCPSALESTHDTV